MNDTENQNCEAAERLIEEASRFWSEKEMSFAEFIAGMPQAMRTMLCLLMADFDYPSLKSSSRALVCRMLAATLANFEAIALKEFEGKQLKEEQPPKKSPAKLKIADTKKNA